MEKIIRLASALLLCLFAGAANARIWDAEDLRVGAGPSGTLPILYINVFDDNELDNDILSRNLTHKEFFSGVYWIESSDKSLAAGSESSPIALEIKARGNFTRLGYAKKPFKLKLDKKYPMLGLTRSKHFALLPHADDYFSYLRNFSAFNLGKRIKLPWTPSQRPVELVVNGDYRGLYFLTETVRVDDDRVNISDDGFLVEMDNYPDDNQFTIKEQSCTAPSLERFLSVTVHTPEECTPAQMQFLTEQFEAMNNAIGKCSPDLWSLLDIDDAARYYIVMELIGHTEAYGGSTYLFRNGGSDEKWHYSPLWDCGHAFEAPEGDWLFNNPKFDNRWIASMCVQEQFRNKVEETWMWFMSNQFPGFFDDANAYIDEITEAAKADRIRWIGVPAPDGYEPFSVADNSNIQFGKQLALTALNNRIEWLCTQFGDYREMDASNIDEPLRDDIPGEQVDIRPIDLTHRQTFTVFNAQGVCIKREAADISDLTSGLYVINGRKVIIGR